MIRSQTPSDVLRSTQYASWARKAEILLLQRDIPDPDAADISGMVEAYATVQDRLWAEQETRDLLR
jgi:hypothetical protein